MVIPAASWGFRVGVFVLVWGRVRGGGLVDILAALGRRWVAGWIPSEAYGRLYRGNTLRFGRVWVKGGMVVIHAVFGCGAGYNLVYFLLRLSWEVARFFRSEM